MREIDSIKEQTGDISALNPRRRRRGKKRENIQKKKRVRERGVMLSIFYSREKKKNNEGEKNIGSGILKKGTALEEKQKSSFFLIGRK